MLAVGILGATVMPHVVYLHSALTAKRIPTANVAERRELLRFQRADVLIAMSLAGVINLTMLVVAAGLFRIPLFLRRAVTMAPSLVVLALGLDPSTTLVISQVVLSFGIPFALVPMILLTRRADIMGELVNRSATTIVASTVAALIIALNLFLLFETFFG